MIVDIVLKVNRCKTTADRSNLNKSDALIFHITNLWQKPRDIPRTRLPHQKYVFFQRESPVHTHIRLSKYNKFFNVMMTYTRDSDVR